MQLAAKLHKTNKDQYKIVLVKKKSRARTGNIKTQLGLYDPHTKKIYLNINKFILWLAKGMVFTNRTEKLFINKFNLLKK